jgi:hypothetical protein
MVAEALNPPLLGAACNPSPCPPSPLDPWAYAYSAPETALLFLVLPSMLIAIVALTAARRQAAGSKQLGYISPS